MERKMNQIPLLLLLVNAFLLLSGAQVAADEAFSGSIIDISTLGAKPGADAAPALMKAWAQACKSPTAVKIVVPRGNYTLSPVDFLGPCESPIAFELGGNFAAPMTLKEFGEQDTWVKFQRTNGITIKAVNGGGVFDGNGEDAWYNPSCGSDGLCKLKPYNFRFFALNDSLIEGITTTDSKMFHVLILNCYNMTLRKLVIKAPEDARNTDGIHLGRSSFVRIVDTVIKTGDDCISVGDGTKNLTVERVRCGPGHGFAIGSLGKFDNEEEVQGIYMKNCTLNGTMFGIRVKTWLNSKPLSVSDLHFEDITMTDVASPIFIDQAYCPSTKCDASVPSNVKISKVSFKNIKGTAAGTPSVMRLVCSTKFPCQDVHLENIDLKYNGPDEAVSECCNVKPVISGTVKPDACALTTTESDSAKKILAGGAGQGKGKHS